MRQKLELLYELYAYYYRYFSHSHGSEEGQKMLHELRAILRKVAPNATETQKCGTPVFEENLILFAHKALKSHINFMPTRSFVEAV